MAALTVGDFASLPKLFKDALTFDSATKFVEKIGQARLDAIKAPKPASERDVSAIEVARQVEQQAEVKTAVADTQTAVETATDRAKAAANDRIASLKDEIDVLRMGERAARAMHAARDGATSDQVKQIQQLELQKQKLAEHQDLLKKGQQLREKMASPMDQLKSQVSELTQMLKAGAIDRKTFDMSAMDAAKRLLPTKDAKETMTPQVSAFERGTVEAFNAARKNAENSREARAAEKKQDETNQLLRQLIAITRGTPRVGIVGG